jgi:hypothetical protein
MVVEFGLADFIALLIAQWIIARFPQRLSNLVNHVSKGIFTDVIAYESLAVF